MSRSYETVRIARDGDRLHVTFDRPERRNAVNFTMMRELLEVFEAAERDTSLRVVVLRGSGGAFSAGGDLGFMRDMTPAPADGPDPLIESYRRMGDTLLCLDRLPQAVVAVIDGPAVGAGLGMACCSDVVIALESAKFGMPEPRSGFIPSQIVPFVVRRLGEGQARRLAVTSRVIEGREAAALGIVHRLCADPPGLEAALAETLADLDLCEPASLATAKRLVRQSTDRSFEDTLDDAAASFVGLLRKPEATAGIEAFLTKQRPPWARRD